MAKIVNIRRDVDDKFYRYKMPELLTKVEGKGNGIKTVLPNVSDVSRSLSRPPTYATKFFGFELGAQTPIDEKNDRYIVNGAHQSDRLRELLDDYITKFVLCGECKNPETDLVLTKNEVIYRDCKACGAKTNVNMAHKLSGYIVRNPPKKQKGGKKVKGAHADAGGAGGVDEKANGGNGAEAEDDGALAAGSDDEFTRKITQGAASLGNVKVDEQDWSLDTSPEAVRARAKLESGMGAMSLGDDGDGSGDEDPNSPYTLLRVWAEENRGTATAVEVYKKVQELSLEKKHKAVQILARSLFTEAVLKEIEGFAAVFKKMVTSEKHQKSMLGGIEIFVGVDHPDLIPSVPKILMSFYEYDIFEDDVLKQWGTHVSKKYVDRDISKKVRKASEPFIKWLDEAEEEDSDEE